MCLCPALRPRQGRRHQANTMPWYSPRQMYNEGPCIYFFRGSITRLWHSLSTLRSASHPAPRKTRFRLLAKHSRTGFTRRVPSKGFDSYPTFHPLSQASWRKHFPFDTCLDTFPANAPYRNYHVRESQDTAPILPLRFHCQGPSETGQDARRRCIGIGSSNIFRRVKKGAGSVTRK